MKKVTYAKLHTPLFIPFSNGGNLKDTLNAVQDKLTLEYAENFLHVTNSRGGKAAVPMTNVNTLVFEESKKEETATK